MTNENDPHESEGEPLVERYIDLEDDLLNAGAMITQVSSKVRDPVFLASVLEILQYIDLLDPSLKDKVIEDIVLYFNTYEIDTNVKDLEGIIEYFRNIEQLPKEEAEAAREEAEAATAETTTERYEF